MHVYYLYCRCNQNPIRHYLAATGCARLRDLTPVRYESLARKRRLPAGAYIFADIELLQGEQKQRVTDIYGHLERDPGRYVLFNNPSLTLPRFPLLRTLCEQGLNDFNVYRAADELSSVSFPVFLRRTDDHRGPQSQLLRDRHALRTELERLAHGGENLNDWLVTEFCNVADQNGMYHKYAAFLVNGRIIARHLFFGTEWVQKYSNKNLPPELLAREREFMANNPYEEQLRRVFQIAAVGYGRIDFGVINGRVQTWEINTNPMICTCGQLKNDPRREVHTGFLDHFHAALDELAASPPAGGPGGAFSGDRLMVRVCAFGEARRETVVGRLCERISWKWKRILGKGKRVSER